MKGLTEMYMVRPLAVWQDKQFWKVGPVCEPQCKAKPIAFFQNQTQKVKSPLCCLSKFFINGVPNKTRFENIYR